jgi:type I restriction enzyme S subunit
VSGSKHADRADALRRFKAYPSYKDSGVKWLGKIPAHWEANRLRFSVELNPPASEVRGLPATTEVSFVPMEAVGEYGGLDLTKTRPIADVKTGYTYFRDGDVVVAKITPCFENGKGARAAGLVGGIAFGTTELHVLRTTSVLDNDFLFYLTLSDAFRRLGEAEMYGAGGQKRVPDSFIENLRHPLPTTPEQRAIAAFLDRETARIDALVAMKEQLLELLQEQRSALITRAVTKGLNSNAALKDSGVEWLGTIPAHWNVKPLKAVSNLQTGLTLGKKFEGRSLIFRPYLRVANVQDGYLALKDIAEIELPSQDAGRFELRNGDVLMTEGGDFDKLGRGYVWEGAIAGCLHQNHIFAVRPRRDLLRPYFLAHAMSSSYGRAYFTATSKQSTNLASTNSNKVKNLPVPLPSLTEQDNILLSIRQGTERTDALITKVREAIDRLKELRAALISAAVTGKIDVREETA